MSWTRTVDLASGPCRHNQLIERDLIEARARSLVTGLSVDWLCVPSTTDEGMAGSTMTDATLRITGGVDTHKDAHVAAALDALGAVLGTQSFPATRAGYRALLEWLAGFGDLGVVGVEGTGAWGAGLARFLTGEGVAVVEVARPNRQHRRRHGKSDPADAIGAARAVLSGEADGAPKTGTGDVEAIRLLQVARRSAGKARTQATNQLHSVIVTAPDALRASLAGLATPALIERAARLRPGRIDTPTAAAKLTLVTLARRCQHLTEEIAELDAHLATLTARCAPTLLALNGVGTQTAAALLTTAGDNPDRLRSEASFAALCGSSPRDASSGRQHRHRLNRGGDRQANAALYIIVISRLRWDPATQAYMARRLAQGKTRKEVIRCLKRYIARQVHQAITTDLGTATTHPRQPAQAAA
jgi:transposase